MKSHRTAPAASVGLSPQHLDRFVSDHDSDLAARHRRQGADIAADQNRGDKGNRVMRNLGYGALVLLAAAILYESTFAAASEESHAPQAPAAMKDGGHNPK